MLETDEKFTELMQEVVGGSQDAARVLFTDYEAHLIRAIRRRMHRRLRSQFDSIDFAQDVWGSFFAQSREKHNFQSPDELISFLTVMAQNKVIDAVRKRVEHRKNSLRQVCSLDDSHAFEKEALVANQSTPSQAISADDEWKKYLSKQPLVYRRIFILLREGKNHQEIADDVGIHLRTVYRLADKLLEDWIL